MDFCWWESIHSLCPSEEWTNVTKLGSSTSLSASQRALLVKVMYPDAPYRYKQRQHHFKLMDDRSDD
jgi:hypothetical protein